MSVYWFLTPGRRRLACEATRAWPRAGVSLNFLTLKGCPHGQFSLALPVPPDKLLCAVGCPDIFDLSGAAEELGV